MSKARPSSQASRHETSAARVGGERLLARAEETAGDVRLRLQAGAPATWDLLCIIDDRERFVGTLRAQELLALADDQTLGGVARRDGPHVGPEVDQEHMASIALRHGVDAMPVLDHQRRVLGVVGPATLMDILRHEHVEDLHRLAGIARETHRARSALEAPPLRRARHRLPWLLVGLLGSVLATWIVARFETALAALPTLAFFIPGLVYLADAIGTQSEAVAVRGLSISRVGMARLMGGELRTGALIGLVLALLALPLVWLAYGDPRLAAAVALALAGASLVASVLGLFLPWLLGRMGLDPAYGSGPLATIVQDVLSLLIYFGCVTTIVL